MTTPSGAPGAGPGAADIADFFSQVGDKIYAADCIVELSDEQLEVQRALVDAYVERGATSATARRLAAKQIQLPPASLDCEHLRATRPAQHPEVARAPNPAPDPWHQEVTPAPEPEPEAELEPAPAPPRAGEATPGSPPKTAPARAPAQKVAKPAEKAPPTKSIVAKEQAPATPSSVLLANKAVLPQWDCAPGVDYVTIKRDGYQRKLTGGEICNPFQDVVKPVAATTAPFRLGYTIRTGRLFVISDDPTADGRTIAWAISGREVCRNNPDPDCLGARAIGPLPPGEYIFASDKAQRVSWGPKTKRQVAAIYLKKLWHRERFSAAQVAAMMKRGNIAIHVRLKGEMSEACLGLEPNGWTYVAGLVRDGRATGLNVYIDEPFPKLAESPPVVTASTFSFTSLFSN